MTINAIPALVLLAILSLPPQWGGDPRHDRPDVIFAIEFWPGFVGKPWQITITRDGVVEQILIGERDASARPSQLDVREVEGLIERLEEASFLAWPKRTSTTVEDSDRHVLAAEIDGVEHRVVVDDLCSGGGGEFAEVWGYALDLVGPLSLGKRRARYFYNGRCR